MEGLWKMWVLVPVARFLSIAVKSLRLLPRPSFESRRRQFPGLFTSCRREWNSQGPNLGLLKRARPKICM